MQTIAEQMKEEFKEEFMETLGPQLKEEGKKETAKQMLLDDIPIEKVVKYTGLSEEEVKALMH